MEGNAVLALLRSDSLEEPEDVELKAHLVRAVGLEHLVAAWVAANAALNAVDGSGDYNRQVEVRPAVWLTARQIVEGLDLERFMHSSTSVRSTAHSVAV
jgi:hypothetical protein